MQRVETAAPPLGDASTVVVLGPDVVLSCGKTEGVPLFERCPPVHSVLLGRCRLELSGRLIDSGTTAVPANTRHRIVDYQTPFAGVAYLDPRRYHFEDVERLAVRWSSFVPGRDDLRELFADTRDPPRRRVDKRLLRALESMETQGASVVDAAAQVDLSASRLTHLMTEILGAPPRSWSAWFKLQRAIGHVLMTGASLTEAAHHAGFADSAHLTRTCKQLTGVRPAMMLPRVLYVADGPTSSG